MKIFILLNLAIFIFSSCSPFEPMPYLIDQSRQKENKYYVPSTSNAPLLGNKNEGSISVNHSLSADFKSLDFQAAFVPVKNVGLTASVSVPTSTYNLIFRRSEAAAGYVLPLSNNWHFETYAGLGTGKIENFHVTGQSRLKYNQLFIQPAIAKKFNDSRLQVALISRLSQASFKVIDTAFNTDRERYSAKQISTAVSKQNHVFFEPGISISSQVRNFVFNTNFTTSAHLGQVDFERQKNVLSFGIAYRFSKPKGVSVD